jgi:hypothetical protein
MSVAPFRAACRRASKPPGRSHNGPPTDADDVAKRLKELGCDPIAELVALARDEAAPLALSARIFADLTNYVAPKRKAEDLCAILGRQPADDDTRLDFSRLSDAELEAFSAMIRKAKGVD